jgi:hypothetical protein
LNIVMRSLIHLKDIFEYRDEENPHTKSRETVSLKA